MLTHYKAPPLRNKDTGLTIHALSLYLYPRQYIHNRVHLVLEMSEEIPFLQTLKITSD